MQGSDVTCCAAYVKTQKPVHYEQLDEEEIDGE